MDLNVLINELRFLSGLFSYEIMTPKIMWAISAF